VEHVNGKMKNKFKFFDSRISASYLPKVHTFWRIGLAIMNACGNVVERDENKYMGIVDHILTKLPNPNSLQVSLIYKLFIIII